MLKIYAEIGYGNPSFCNTEIEKGKLEHRVERFILPPRIDGVYLRIWIGKKVYVLSSKTGFSVTVKNRKKLKFLLGMEGGRQTIPKY